MAHPWHHAVSSARKHGGEPEDYLAIHEWFDASKAHHGDFRHRALRHHTLGVFECEREFGVTLDVERRPHDSRSLDRRAARDRGPRLRPVGLAVAVGDRAGPWMMRSRRLSRELERAEVRS